jgi:hypothetical protein
LLQPSVVLWIVGIPYFEPQQEQVVTVEMGRPRGKDQVLELLNEVPYQANSGDILHGDSMYLRH